MTDPLEGVEIGGATVSDAVVLNNQFGFVLMELVGEVWQMSIRDVEGEVILECEVDGNEATCFP